MPPPVWLVVTPVGRNAAVQVARPHARVHRARTGLAPAGLARRCRRAARRDQRLLAHLDDPGGASLGVGVPDVAEINLGGLAPPFRAAPIGSTIMEPEHRTAPPGQGILHGASHHGQGESASLHLTRVTRSAIGCQLAVVRFRPARIGDPGQT